VQRFASLLVTTALFLHASAAFATDWQEIKDESGIKAWKREVEGSSLVEFRGKGKVAAPLLLVAAVIRNSDREIEWMEDCNGSFAIQWLSPTHAFSYNRTKSPVFFISDRDTVVEVAMNVHKDKREVEVTFKNAEHKRVPPIEHIVRMPDLNGHWMLTQVDANTTEVEYQVHADPGGSLPHWIVNWVSEELPWGTIARLREQVKKPGYEKDITVLTNAIDWTGFIAPPESLIGKAE
jgi:hypothetical protein